MAKRLTEHQKAMKSFNKAWDKTEKVLYTAVTGKKRRKKTTIEKIIKALSK